MLYHFTDRVRAPLFQKYSPDGIQSWGRGPDSGFNFLHVYPEMLKGKGVMFTADVSNKAGVTIHSLEEAKKMIDFEVLYLRLPLPSSSAALACESRGLFLNTTL
jgi:hypothetical protein